MASHDPSPPSRAPDDTRSIVVRAFTVLMIVELLYTIQVSFREHTIAAEPFLIVGLVAAIRP